MGNFKNAKEFDRDPLRKSDFYQKTLKPTSGKSLGERWKPLRKSENIEDLTIDPVRQIIEAESKTMKQDENLPKSGASADKKPRVKRTNPHSKSDRLNSQVTPGKWTTK